jgi:uncharacterized membrane protein
MPGLGTASLAAFGSLLVVTFLGIEIHALLGVLASVGLLLTVLSACGLKRTWHTVLGSISAGLVIGCDLAGAVALHDGATVTSLHVIGGLCVALIVLLLTLGPTSRTMHRLLGGLLGMAWLAALAAPRWLR